MTYWKTQLEIFMQYILPSKWVEVLKLKIKPFIVTVMKHENFYNFSKFRDHIEQNQQTTISSLAN